MTYEKELDVKLADDMFVHFAPINHIVEIIKSGKIMMDPPHEKFGGDAVFAVSTQFGQVVPGVQTTHINDPSTAALLFTTKTMPTIGFSEEVVWDEDVVLGDFDMLTVEQANELISASPLKISDETNHAMFV